MPEPRPAGFTRPDDEVPSQGRGLHQQVVNRLGEMIAAGDLAPETQLVPELVGEQLGASRSVIREALRVLEAKGMVRPRPKTGTRVLPMSHWNLLDPDLIRWRVSGPDGTRQLNELADLRAAVENHAARLCAENATDDQVTALRAACDEMERTGLAGDLEGFTAADVTFHAMILEASGSSVFEYFATPFSAFLHARIDLHTLPARVDGSVLENHRLIVRAIADKDPAAAEAHSRSVFEAARVELRERLAQRQAR